MKRLFLLIAGLALVITACSGDRVNGFANVASSSVGVGEQRVLIVITNPDTGEYLAAPDVAVEATLRDEDGAPLAAYPGEFAWIVPDIRGLYIFEMAIPGPGTFQVTVTSDAFNEAGPVGLVTVEDPLVVAIGEKAPLSVTRTSADHDLSVISSDPDPDPSFYAMSLDVAIEDGPTALVFATPAWCTSEACGPMLDQLKALSPDYPTINFVHVEVYEDLQVDSFEELTIVPAVSDWSLPAEPWVFVMDSAGTVVASFEGVASDAELAEALSSVSG